MYETRNHFGTAEGEFKTRYNNHKSSFTHRNDENIIEPSSTFGTWNFQQMEQLALTHGAR